MVYVLIVAVVFVLGFVAGYFSFRACASGTLVKDGDIWRLELGEDFDKLDKKKRIIFNVSNDKEVV